MTRNSMLAKVRKLRLTPPKPTPKEQEAWKNFLALVEEMSGDAETVPPIVHNELARLVANGNPLAISFQRRIENSTVHTRAADEAPLPPPAPRKVTGPKWGKPGQGGKS